LYKHKRAFLTAFCCIIAAIDVASSPSLHAQPASTQFARDASIYLPKSTLLIEHSDKLYKIVVAASVNDKSDVYSIIDTYSDTELSHHERCRIIILEEASASADAAHSLGAFLLMFATSRAPEDRDSLMSSSSEEARSAKSRFNSLKVQAANAMHTCSSNNVDLSFFNEIQILAAEMANVLDGL
jgi:hypothetical protein